MRQIAHELLKTFAPNLPVRHIQTRGLLAQPLMLHELLERTETGELVRVLDHKAMEFRAENTSFPEVWDAWQKFMEVGLDTETTALPSSNAKARNLLIRTCFLNYAPHPVNGVRAMVSMQHPAD